MDKREKSSLRESGHESPCSLIRLHGVVRPIIQPFRGEGDFDFSKIIEYQQTHIKADIKNLTANICDVRNFKLPSGEGIPVPEYLNGNDVIQTTGTFEGNYFDFFSNLEWKIDENPLVTDIHFKYVEDDTLVFSTNFVGKELALGHFFNLKNILGKGNISGSLSGHGTGFDDATIEANIILKKLQLLEYPYDSITITGRYYNNSLTGTVACNDKNLMMKTKGNIRFDGSGSYKAHADIVKADLKNLGLIHSDFAFSTKADLSVRGNDVENIVADLDFDSTYLHFGDSIYFLDTLTIRKHNIEHAKTITFASDFLDGTVSGQFKLLNLQNDFVALLNHYFVIDDDVEGGSDSVNYMHISATVKNDELLNLCYL